MHLYNGFSKPILSLAFFISVAAIVSTTPVLPSTTISENFNSQATTNRETGGVILPPDAPDGIYEAPIPGHPANPHLPLNASVIATLIAPLTDLDLLESTAPASLFSSNLDIPDPKHMTCRRDRVLSAEGHGQIHGDVIPYWWDGKKITIRPGRTNVHKFHETRVFFCNMSLSKSMNPRADRYYSVDGYVEGMCGSRTEGGLGVKGWGAVYGRRKYVKGDDIAYYCKNWYPWGYT